MGDPETASRKPLCPKKKDSGSVYRKHQDEERSPEAPFPVPAEALPAKAGVRLTDPDTRVFRAENGAPQLAVHDFGKGKAAYLSGFTYSPEAARMLLDLLAYLTGTDETAAAACESPLAEAAWFPKARKLVVLNNGETALRTAVAWPDGSMDIALEPMETRIMEV